MTELPAASNQPKSDKTAASGVPMMPMPFRLHSRSTLTQKESDIKSRETINKGSTVVATVRGVLVVLRMCEGAHVDLSARTRQEVRTVKSLNNENLMKFVGACIESDHVSVFGEYCSRGTLQVRAGHAH
ncbi:hypothetical protein RvY_18097 [Ramazzottius varieornatus]|uniref:Serine-threonine/tyrosine-protein kinase catalytic domain-containing protein n=1 Tax=Ramazzottius varieornatus TaxID=947166 RepID=A0A1D1W9W5_RAMVA|nr:hypothetical protein RvY_18097 [Ramazzottius varieornatus]